jgi:FkbM family methyltransferase
MTPNSGGRRVSWMALEGAHIWNKLTGRRRRAQRAAKHQFAAVLAQLKPGDIAIDLGANVGEFTVQMARTGARVYAFEPDPHAFAILRENTAALPNVTLIHAAAGTEDGTIQLYRATGFARDRNRKSKSSSVFADKRNVSADNAVTVELCDFVAFLQGLDAPVRLIKIDIEGAEVPLLEAVLAAPVAARIGHVFVETHERGLPHLAARTQALKATTRTLDIPRVNWDWH